MIASGIISKPLKEFILQSQKAPNPDSSAAIDDFCKKIEEVIVDAIKQATITIPLSAIQVTGPSGISSNVAPIILSKAIG